MTDTAAVDAIRRHVTSLFDAYLAGDRQALADGRIDTWKGFQIRSTRLVRGVDAYMDALDAVLGTLQVERYEFLDFDVDVYGDIAIVLYVARDHLAGDDGLPTGRTVLIRSLDVYRRIDGEWTQIASNINAMPDPDSADDAA